MRLVRQQRTNYPAYIAYPQGSETPVAWVEQAAGRRNGWCVHRYGTTPGDNESGTLWFGSFREAKDYAREMVEGTS